MQRYQGLDELQLAASVLTIGSFDGVHLGHQDLIRRLVGSAQQRGLPSVVLTFFPHPSVVLGRRQQAFYINTPDEKAELLSGLGVDHVVTQSFDLEFSRLEAEDFLDWLDERLGFRQLWAGEDFALGHNRRGDRAFLEREGKRRGFEFCVVPPIELDGEPVSATRVRQALRAGQVAQAARCLGRPFALPGTVVRGAGRGAQLGIPTANLKIWEERAYPARGVYACWAELDGRRWPAVTNVGLRPTFEDQLERPVVEAHLLDYSSSEPTGFYDRELTLYFVERLRDEQRFDGPQALIKQIERDIDRARELLD